MSIEGRYFVMDNGVFRGTISVMQTMHGSEPQGRLGGGVPAVELEARSLGLHVMIYGTRPLSSQ